MICFYDRKDDTAFFKVKEGHAVADEEQDWGGVQGYDQDGEVVSVEIWFAANTLPKWLLAAMPEPLGGTTGDALARPRTPGALGARASG